MNQILVPFDFSNNARNALAYAAELAKKAQAELLVLHAYDRAAILEGVPLDSTTASLEELAKKVARDHGLPDTAVRASVVEGELTDEVAEAIASSGADLIVMGTRGASGIKEVLVGSRTVSLLDAVMLPMLIIPGEAAFGPVGHILLCSDLKEVDDDDALDLVKEMALLLGAGVRIAHVEPDGGHASYEESLERSREMGIFRPEVEVSFKRITGMDVMDGIRYYLDKKGDNGMVALINRRHSFFDRLFRTNHTHAMAYHTTLPLLVLPESRA